MKSTDTTKNSRHISLGCSWVLARSSPRHVTRYIVDCLSLERSKSRGLKTGREGIFWAIYCWSRRSHTKHLNRRNVLDITFGEIMMFYDISQSTTPPKIAGYLLTKVVGGTHHRDWPKLQEEPRHVHCCRHLPNEEQRTVWSCAFCRGRFEPRSFAITNTEHSPP